MSGKYVREKVQKTDEGDRSGERAGDRSGRRSRPQVRESGQGEEAGDR